MNNILVTGATGNVGKHVVSQLAQAGIPVRALVRDPSRARLPENVQVVAGDLTAPETLEPALRDVDSVFLVWPGFAAETAEPVVEAVAKHARRVVYLSADVPGAGDDDEPTIFHQRIERLIKRTGMTWTFLRPGGFAVNTLGWADQIREGVVRWPYGAASRSLIHEKDIAAVATHVLTSGGHAGAAYVITGPERLTQAEQVRVIGEAVGREVRWEDMPPEEARQVLTAAWGDPGFVESALRGWESFVTAPEKVTDTVERLLGRPALTFHEWARDHAADFR
ncbi:NAD(P)H-binding protein [Nonomuraea sp. SMC257]|uniref:NAD(P)H-binding protein n=1 Tax=Nonomuraea montanisoli TaxID=2741721 RepID=A0A7Y6I8J0_9ACTN|nr:NAD(P)H-binding protein [Nonomuraea montanisoli]NUW33614.1 NAD(P)H-binding protein [Nonomuraea montanisoli]